MSTEHWSLTNHSTVQVTSPDTGEHISVSAADQRWAKSFSNRYRFCQKGGDKLNQGTVGHDGIEMDHKCCQTE